MQFSPNTVDLFEALLNDFKLAANNPQFDILASRISMARAELMAYHAQAKAPQTTTEPSATKFEEPTDSQESA